MHRARARRARSRENRRAPRVHGRRRRPRAMRRRLRRARRADRRSGPKRPGRPRPADRRSDRRRSAPDAVLVVLCQVPPGFTRALQRPGPTPLLPGRDAGLRPRGRARAQARALSSSAAPIRAAPLPAALQAVSRTPSAARSCRCAYESAELAKIAINCCLVASISVANTLAELCERSAPTGPRSCRR